MWDETTEDGHNPTEEENLFLQDYLEVEQILACDERNMELKLFMRQRALKLQKALFEMEEHIQGKKMKTVALEKG